MDFFMPSNWPEFMLLTILFFIKVTLVCLVLGSAVAVPSTTPGMRQESTTPGMRQDGPLIPMKPFRSLDASIEDDDDEPLIDENGIYVVDDLRLTEDQYKANFGTDEEMRQALPSSNYRWTGGVVPYEFDSTVSADVRGKITSALDTLNKALVNCVVLRFVFITIHE